MASFTTEKLRSGKLAYLVDVAVPGIGRKRIRLGSTTKRDASRFCMRIQSLEDTARLRSPVRREDEEWLRNLPHEQFEKIRRTGLLEHTTIPTHRMSLREWVDEWLNIVLAQCEKRTHELYKQSSTLFLDYLDQDLGLLAIKREHAERWHTHLIESGIKTASVRRHIRQLKACFNAAIKRDIIMRNPFDRIESASVAAKRSRIITDIEAEKVLNELPSIGYKLLFALARFAGLRSPSETMILTWDKVDLENNRLEVYAPKTHQTRMVPILPQLRALLDLAMVESNNMTGLLLNISYNNHARTIKDAATRAGVELWPKIFQTLRQSFSTTLCERFPEHVVAAWAGHSPEIARRHYMTMRDEYFTEASRRSTGRSTSGRNGVKCAKTELNGTEQTCSDLPPKTKQHNTLRNSPARIRTGDRAIMSREL